MSNTIFESASIFSSVLFDFQSFTVNLFVSMLLLILESSCFHIWLKEVSSDWVYECEMEIS